MQRIESPVRNFFLIDYCLSPSEGFFVLLLEYKF